MSDNPTIHRDAFNLLCDERIGSGMSRVVFSSLVLADCVIKVEEAAASFQNVMEWQAWQQVKDTEFAGWFAPCEWISPNGAVLVMKRTEPVASWSYPKRMPAFFTDFKRRNYGWLGGRLVCHDYGTALLMQVGLTKRMRRADWVDAP